VLQVVLSLNPGGTERLVVEIVRRLKTDLPMAVCCLDAEGAWAAELRSRGVPVKALSRAPGFHPVLGRRIARFADEHRASIVHSHHYSPFVYGAIARFWRPNLGVIFTEHGRLSDEAPSLKRRIANVLLSRAPREVVAVSDNLRQHLVAEGFPRKSVRVVYNGIDVGPVPDTGSRERARRQLAIRDDRLVVGTIARLDRVKDLETLIRAFAALPGRQAATLIVIGDGDERTRLERIADETQADVRLLGHREDARQLLAGCDIYANSSIHEGISLTILEAMAARLPVVATRVGGTPEIVDDTCGRLAPARDSTALTNALGELAQDARLREELGQSGRQRVEERFTLDRMVEEYRQAYYRAIGAPPPVVSERACSNVP
jgi:glycosyltransferase involved in cell wall biosynthesis